MLKSKLSGIFTNLTGWHTNRKIIVIDSDDWGSIRMPDKITYDILLSKGIRVDNCPFCRYDSLASEEDLTLLFELLDKFRDINGNPPIITANTVLVNPDFERIRKSDFTEYHYELFTDSLKNYPEHSGSFNIWKEGIANNMFHPEFHGREHLHVSRWMKALRQNLPETRLAFDHRLFGLSKNISSENRKSYLAAFDIDEISDFNEIKKIIKDGLVLFRNIFGYSSRSFIAPNYTWPLEIEEDLSVQNIKYIKGRTTQISPVINSSKSRKIHHYTGKKNSFGQIYLTRKCQFEPSLDNDKDSVNECLSQIDDAFSWKKPAIITSHRLNFIGSIEKSNRDNSLYKLRNLLSVVQKKWPDTEFMTADGLGDLICKKKTQDNER